MVILGADLSLNSPAFAVVSYDNKFVLNEVIVVNNKKIKTRGEKLARIRNVLSALFIKYDINKCIKERSFVQHAKATQAIFEVVGVVEELAWSNGKHEFIDVTPKTIKLLIGGSGSASKQDVADGLEKFVGKVEYETDDASDAVACTIAWVLDNKLDI